MERFWHDLQILSDGDWVTKIPTTGVQRDVLLRLTKNLDTGTYRVTWNSNKRDGKSMFGLHRQSRPKTYVPLLGATLHEGLSEGQFKKPVFQSSYGDMEDCCFTLEGSNRSLDIVCDTREHCDRWVRTLRKLIEQGGQAKLQTADNDDKVSVSGRGMHQRTLTGMSRSSFRSLDGRTNTAPWNPQYDD